MKLKEASSPASLSVRNIFDLIPHINAERTSCGLDQIIDLSIGQPSLPPNPYTFRGITGLIENIDKLQALGYSPVRGRPETLQAMQQLFKLYYPKVEYSCKEVMCTNGANQAIWNALSILIKNQTSKIVMVFEPFFGHYDAQVFSLGGKLIKIQTEVDNFNPNISKLREALSQYPDTGILILNFPNNPSGNVIDPKVILELISTMDDFPNITLIMDDVYRELSFKPVTSLLDIAPSYKSRSIVINSCSKGLIGAPDLRIGMVAAPEKWINAMANQQMLVTSSISYLSQLALISAIESRLNGDDASWSRQVITTYQSSAEYLAMQLNKMGLTTSLRLESTFYLLVDCSILLNYQLPDTVEFQNSNQQSILIQHLHKKIGSDRLQTDIQIVYYLLHVAGVAVVPGSAFGLESSRGFVRLCCAKEKHHLEQFIKRVGLAIDYLKNNSKKIMLVKKMPLPIESKSHNVAIVGVGNIGEWISYMIMNAILTGQLKRIDKIYYLGPNSKKLEAKISDQLHASIIQLKFSRQIHRTDIIDHLLGRIQCVDDFSILKQTDIIITAFGAPMSSTIRERSDLLLANGKIAAFIAEKIKRYSSQRTTVINVANPLDVMTWYIQTLSGLPKTNVLGVSGVLDVSRLTQAIHQILGVNYSCIDFNTLAVYGEHGPHLVPMLSHVKVNGRSLLEQVTAEQAYQIIRLTALKGTDMMESLGKVPPHIGTAQAAVTMLHALVEDTSIELSCSIWNEEYQVCMGSPVVVNSNNEIMVKPIQANVAEKDALIASARTIYKNMSMIGQIHLSKNSFFRTEPNESSSKMSLVSHL